MGLNMKFKKISGNGVWGWHGKPPNGVGVEWKKATVTKKSMLPGGGWGGEAGDKGKKRSSAEYQSLFLGSVKNKKKKKKKKKKNTTNHTKNVERRGRGPNN